MTSARIPKIALVSSVGGHLRELLAIREAFDGCESVFVLQDHSPLLPPDARAYLVAHSRRDWRAVFNMLELLTIFSRELPDVVVSTGAGIAVPAAIIGRLLGIPYIHIEPSSSVTRLSLTGRLVQPFASRFYVQWPELQRRGSTYAGCVL